MLSVYNTMCRGAAIRIQETASRNRVNRVAVGAQVRMDPVCEVQGLEWGSWIRYEVYAAADLEGIERPNDHSLLFFENPFTAMREDLGFRI
jgi:hypothetical protein